MSANDKPDVFNATITFIIDDFPLGGGDIESFRMSADFSGLPVGLATLNTATRRITVAVKIPSGGSGVIGDPKPGTQINFQFKASPGFTVQNVTGLIGVGLIWKPPVPGTDGTTTVTAVVTGSRVSVGTEHHEYALVVGQEGSNAVGKIDPDFETDISTGSP